MRWVLKGKSDRDIGEILEISHTTVKFHIERVKKKLPEPKLWQPWFPLATCNTRAYFLVPNCSMQQ